MLVVAQNDTLIRPMIHLFPGIYSVKVATGLEFGHVYFTCTKVWDLSLTTCHLVQRKKIHTHTKKIPTHRGRQGSFSEVDHPHKTPFIPQKLKAMVTKLDILEWINVR